MRDGPPNLEGLTAIVLAAGLSRRAAPHNKLLLPAARGSVVHVTVEAICAAGFSEVIVVLGHERERVGAALAGLAIRGVFAPDYALGMGHSLAAGVRAAIPGAAGFAITPGDLPYLTGALVRQIARQFHARGDTHHVIPTARGERGHPVIIGGWLRAQLAALTGDRGARSLLMSEDERARCQFLEVNDAAILRDIDTPPATPGV